VDGCRLDNHSSASSWEATFETFYQGIKWLEHEAVHSLPCPPWSGALPSPINSTPVPQHFIVGLLSMYLLNSQEKSHEENYHI